MLIEDFKRVLTAFADTPTDLDISRGTILVQVRDELIEARVSQQGGQLVVEEDDQRLTAESWLVNRIAKIPLLAERITSYVTEVEGFVPPSGKLLDQPDFAEPSDDVHCDDASIRALEVLARRPAGTTSVLYVTSDAGEGKTTLINHMARSQAAEYKAKRSNWLLVPIPLGGRTFLRFDDVVVAALVNRLRFQLLYYDAFIELVRLGVLVPAFDGFEEMIIASSSGEAISALGNLVRSLSSSGSVLIAARKAYFDYQSFRAQARLFDAVGLDSVAFARLALDRWNRAQFLAYAGKRNLPSPEVVYDAVADRLRSDHPILTRAVLVKRLVDVALNVGGLNRLLDQIGNAPQHYFFQFVNALVEREAREKWIDQSGEPQQPLLTVEEHHELLGMVAQEMWIAATDALRPDVLATVAEVFAEAKGKAPIVARQVRERLQQHSLLVSPSKATSARAFDHEDFRSFYLGEAVGRVLCRGPQGELRAMLNSGVLPRAAVDEACLHVRRVGGDVLAAVTAVQGVAKNESGSSVARESCGALAIGLIDEGQPFELSNMSFPEDALRGRTLTGLVVRDSYFQGTSLARTRLHECAFERCHFERLELSGDSDIAAKLVACDVAVVVRGDRDERNYDPAQVRVVLAQAGFVINDGQQELQLDVVESDEELMLVERTLRIFLRSTQANESFIRTKLGVKATLFIDHVLPSLLKAGVLQEVQYLGHGTQRRFRISVQMEKLEDALGKCGGNFERFLEMVTPSAAETE